MPHDLDHDAIAERFMIEIVSRGLAMRKMGIEPARVIASAMQGAATLAVNEDGPAAAARWLHGFAELIGEGPPPAALMN